MKVTEGESSKLTNYSYDANNSLLQSVEDVIGGSVNIKKYLKYDYDNNGNQLSKVSYQLAENTTSPAEYGTVQLGYAENRGEPTNQNIKDTEVNSYNGFNQLIRTDIGYTTAEYAYRPDGFRMSKTVNKETTYHLWDGSNIVADLNSNMSVKDKYLRGINLIKNSSSYYLFNAHGDVVQLANTGGAVTKNYKYDAFGAEINIDEADRNPFRYSGEYLDLSSGLYYLRSRYYNPTIGRFFAEDSYKGDSLYLLSLNLYTYCWNNPISFVDPSGNSPERMSKNHPKWLPDARFQGWINFSLGGVKDEQGIYHLSQNYWQSISFVGYNDLYDEGFNFFSSTFGGGMAPDKFDFNYDGENYILWAWKGDYLNLGAGAEMGIYKGGEPHWFVDKSLAMPMTLQLLDKDNKEIFNWTPEELKWWVTGFDPSKKGVGASDLTAIFTIDFSDNKEMYKAFYEMWQDDTRWTFDNYIAKFTF